VLYEMLTGEPPFTGPTNAAVLARAAEDRPPPIKTLCPSIPFSVEQAVVKALAKRPEDRPASATAFARALGCDIGMSTPPV
jgi:eukaryotic-like serine/threonine-protein kinase